MYTSGYDHHKHNNHNTITNMLWNKNNLGFNEISSNEMALCRRWNGIWPGCRPRIVGTEDEGKIRRYYYDIYVMMSRDRCTVFWK